MTLRAIGKSMYGTAYSFDGAIPLDVPDISALDFGDTVRDNGGVGMLMCVNICCLCRRPYLAGVLILCQSVGPCCSWGAR